MADPTFPRYARCRTCGQNFTQLRSRDICPACHAGKPCLDCGALFWNDDHTRKRCATCARAFRPKASYTGEVVALPLRYGKKGKISADQEGTFYEKRGGYEERERRAALRRRLDAMRR